MGKQLSGTYAAAYLCKDDADAIKEFLCFGWGIDENDLTKNFHLTLYTSTKRLPGLCSTREGIRIECDIEETRFMVMAPGGENPRPELEPSRQKVGIRFTTRNVGIDQIQSLRQRVCWYETPDVVGNHRPSSRKTNAFGARHFQPHMTLLRRGAQIERDLREIGAAFRSAFQYVCFDTFTIKIS